MKKTLLLSLLFGLFFFSFPQPTNAACTTISIDPEGPIGAGTTFTVTAVGCTQPASEYEIQATVYSDLIATEPMVQITPGTYTATFTTSQENLGTLNISVWESGSVLWERSTTLTDDPPNQPPTADDQTLYMLQVCQQAGPLAAQCNACVLDTEGMWTAIGCIPASGEGIANSLITALLSLAGGIALIFILFGSFKIATSSGDPARLDSGKQTLIAAIVGLLLIVLSVSILSFIGVDILQIPGL